MSFKNASSLTVRTSLAGIVLAGAGCSASGQNIECPVTATIRAGGIPVSTGLLTQIGQMLASNDSETGILEAKNALQRAAPFVTTPECIDVLGAARCPSIDRDNALDKAAKARKFDGFTQPGRAVLKSA